jgi:enoyl-CoA hydratase/carnithine racemase
MISGLAVVSRLGRAKQALPPRLIVRQYSTNPLVSWTHNETTKIGTITLDSPATYNALTVEMGQVFLALVRQLESDIRHGVLNVNAVVVTGAGNDAFSAGGNFEWLRSLKDRPVHVNADAMLSFYKSFLCIRQLPVPVVAAIQGPAIGAGAGLALACDLRVTSPGPRRLGFTFSRLGIHSGMGSSHLLTQSMGGPSAIINEILLTGKALSGEEAYKFGLVNRLVENVKEEAHAMAEEVARQNPMSIRSMIQTLRQRQDEGLEACLQREAYAQAICYNRDDWGEGLDALIERRDPLFGDYHAKKN